MKLKLDNDILNEDFFENSLLFGVTAPLKNYYFCWLVNNYLGFKFRLNTDIEIHLRKKNRSYFFNIYECKDLLTAQCHYLYHNHCDGEYLLPEFKHIDFLWLIKADYLQPNELLWIKQAVKEISGVQLVADLAVEQIKNKGNMVF